jgi:hypothetical protein
MPLRTPTWTPVSARAAGATAVARPTIMTRTSDAWNCRIPVGSLLPVFTPRAAFLHRPEKYPYRSIRRIHACRRAR